MREIELKPQQDPRTDLPPFYVKCPSKPTHWQFDDREAERHFSQQSDWDLLFLDGLFRQCNLSEIQAIASIIHTIRNQRANERLDLHYEWFGRYPEPENTQQQRFRSRMITK